jgi:SUMO ligase MMS21 Smc5/6 complex component
MAMNNDGLTQRINSQTVRLKLVDGSNVTGQINLNRHPMYERVSDIVTQNTEQFLVLFAVSVDTKNTEKVNHKTLLINREHIIWAAPQEIE